MNHLNLFLILIIALVLLLFLLVILLIIFRDFLEKQCCGSRDERDSRGEASNRRGLRNLAFDDQENLGEAQQSPFSNMEAMEAPPSYEEAVKQELFRFRLPTPQRTRSISPSDSSDGVRPSTSHSENTSIVIDPASLPSSSLASQSHPSTSQERPQPSRSRSSTTSSISGWNNLTTIEEESEESPMTFVIDCIGIQASRLLEKCDTTVELTFGSELTSHSKC